jgi:hypothetical protein
VIESAQARADRVADENDAALSDAERKAIMALHRLAKRWPRTLTLVSMGGNLHVIRTGDPRFGLDGWERTESVIQTITGIPNDGGDW